MKLLLDVDGVIVRDKVLLDHMRYNVITYVRKKVPGRDPVKLNGMLYTKYGHTARGLAKEFGIDTRDFNAHVYDPHLMNHLYDFIKMNDEFKQDVDILKSISHNWEIELFSNAPLEWTNPLCLAIGHGCVSKDQYDKPNIESYVRFFDHSDTKIVFVDDMMCNLLPVLFFERWTPVHFSSSPNGTNFIETVESMSDLKNVLGEIQDTFL